MHPAAGRILMHATFPEEDMTSITPFQFEQHEVRVVEIYGEPWFVAKDVAARLGYKDTDYAVRAHCKGAEDSPVPTAGGVQMMKIIPERDVYRLIIRSNLPEAERFEEWVVGEVLPSIRKTGQYQAKPPLPDPAATLLAIGKGLLDMVPGINPAIMAAKTLTAITDNTGLDTSALRLALPASETPTEALLNATQLGKLLGISAQKVNKRLTEAGLQYRDDKGNWLLTPEGTKHAEALPFERHGHAGYQVMWRATVVGLIETHH